MLSGCGFPGALNSEGQKHNVDGDLWTRRRGRSIITSVLKQQQGNKPHYTMAQDISHLHAPVYKRSLRFTTGNLEKKQIYNSGLR